MKIRFQLLAFAASWSLLLSPSFAQTTIPNGDFENWDDVGQNTEEPTNWNSNETGSGVSTLGPQTCFRESNNPYNGTYCLRLTNASFFGTPINASATTGRIEAPTTNPADGYIRTLTGNTDFNTPFTGRPDSLVGWFQYTPGSGDAARIQAVLHGNYDVEVPDQGGSAPYIIAEAAFNTSNTVNGWTRFSVPFVYNNSNTPTHILLIATASGTVGSAAIGSELLLDGLEAIYNVNTSIDEPQLANASIYPNPNRGDFQINLGGQAEAQLSIVDINGRVVLEQQLQDNNTTITLDQPAGLYFVRLVTNREEKTIKLIKQ